MRLVVVERDVERQIFAPVVAAAGGEIDAAVAEQIERRPLLGDADRMVQRQHGHGRRKADMLGARGDVGEHQLGRGEHAERVEMMLADPGRMHAELVGVERLGGDVGDELVGVARVVLVVIVAQREISEFHFSSFGRAFSWAWSFSEANTVGGDKVCSRIICPLGLSNLAGSEAVDETSLVWLMRCRRDAFPFSISVSLFDLEPFRRPALLADGTRRRGQAGRPALHLLCRPPYGGEHGSLQTRLNSLRLYRRSAP